MATASCFASYDQLYGNSKDHLILRRDICNWMDAHQEDHEGFVEDDKSRRLYIEELRLKGSCPYNRRLFLVPPHFARNTCWTDMGIIRKIRYSSRVECFRSPDEEEGTLKSFNQGSSTSSNGERALEAGSASVATAQEQVQVLHQDRAKTCPPLTSRMTIRNTTPAYAT